MQGLSSTLKICIHEIEKGKRKPGEKNKKYHCSNIAMPNLLGQQRLEPRVHFSSKCSNHKMDNGVF